MSILEKIDPEIAGIIRSETERQEYKLELIASENYVSEAVLEASGSSLKSVVKTTVFLRDMNDVGVMNIIYGEFFTEDYPARSAVQAARLPKDGAVEIEAIALLE